MEVARAKKAEANVMKEMGNAFYKEKNYHRAVKSYDKAIDLYPDDAIFFNNKAQALIRLDLWEEVRIASIKALNLEHDGKPAAKASINLGQALFKLREFDESIIKLKKGITLIESMQKSDRPAMREYKQRAHRTIGECHVEQYLAMEKDQLYSLNRAKEALELRLSAEELEADFTYKRLTEIEKNIIDRTVPDYLVCNVTLGLMHDPVITPSGNTFERRMIEETIQKFGKDPVSQDPLNIQDLVPNRAIQEATSSFIQSHPWAWMEFGMDRDVE